MVTTGSVHGLGTVSVLLVLAVAGVSCGVAATPSRGAPVASGGPAPSGAAVPSGAPARAPAGASARPSRVVAEAEDAAPRRDERLDTEWRWLRGRFAEASEYRVDTSDSLQTLLAWANPGEAITIFDRSCRAVSVRRNGDQLEGYVHRALKLSSDELTEDVDQIRLGTTLALSGCNSRMYARNADGDWELVGSGGIGCERQLGHLLSKVTSDAAWYDGAEVELSIECSRLVEEEMPCRDGSRRSCTRCETWWLAPTSNEFGGHAPGTTRKVALREPADCSVPCSLDRPEDVRRADAVVAGRSFFTDLDVDAHPFVFRTELACQAYRKVHRFSRDELDVWSISDNAPSR
jgi:hypothetical protein